MGLKSLAKDLSILFFVIRVNLLHPYSSWFFCGLLLSLLCFPTFVKHFFQVFCNLKAKLSIVKIPQNIATEPL